MNGCESTARTFPDPLPLVNKARALYQWGQDLPGAAALCWAALVLDDECNAAVGTLAQLSLKKWQIEEAIELFLRHAEIVRTAAERVQALNHANVSIKLS
jgi:import receptor subunit TOM70